MEKQRWSNRAKAIRNYMATVEMNDGKNSERYAKLQKQLFEEIKAYNGLDVEELLGVKGE